MELSHKTIEFISKLSSVNLLSYSGTPPHPDDSEDFVFVDRSVAKMSLLSQHWSNTILEAKNGCSMCLDQSQLKRWNPITIAANDSTLEVSEAITTALSGHFEIEKVERIKLVRHVVRRMITGACLEIEYDGYLSLGFFNEVCHVMMMGRLVCGFKGEFPKGKLIVY